MKAKITYARPRVLINVQRMTENFYSKRRVNALKTGIKRCSVPDKVLIDNGKEIVPVGKAVKPVYVTEYCSCCEHEATIQWKTKTDGFKSYCPYCGERLMLCSECLEDSDGGNCDWDAGSCTCKHTKDSPYSKCDRVERDRLAKAADKLSRILDMRGSGAYPASIRNMKLSELIDIMEEK